MAETLRPDERIRHRAAFQRVFEQGIRTHGRALTLHILPNNLDLSRLGIVASRKLGGAVHRTRAKRLIREVFRRNKPVLAPGFDIVAVARRELLHAHYDELEADYRSALRRLLRHTAQERIQRP